MNSFVSFLEGLRMWADRANMGEILAAASILAAECKQRGLRLTITTSLMEGDDGSVSGGIRSRVPADVDRV